MSVISSTLLFLFVVVVVSAQQPCSTDAATYNSTARAFVLSSPASNFSSNVCVDFPAIYYNFTLTNATQWNLELRLNFTPGVDCVVFFYDSNGRDLGARQGVDFISYQRWLQPGTYTFIVRSENLGSNGSVSFDVATFFSGPCSPDVPFDAPSRGRRMPSSTFLVNGTLCPAAVQVFYNFTITTQPVAHWFSTVTVDPASEVLLDLDLFDQWNERPISEFGNTDLEMNAFLLPGNYAFAVRTPRGLPIDVAYQVNTSVATACSPDAGHNQIRYAKRLLPIAPLYQFTSTFCRDAYELFYNFTVVNNGSTVNTTVSFSPVALGTFYLYDSNENSLFQTVNVNGTQSTAVNVTAGEYSLYVYSFTGLTPANFTVTVSIPSNPIPTSAAPTNTNNGGGQVTDAASTISVAIALVLFALVFAVSLI